MFFGWSRKGGEGGRGEQNRGSKPGEQTGKEYAPFAVVFMQLIAHLFFVFCSNVWSALLFPRAFVADTETSCTASEFGDHSASSFSSMYSPFHRLSRPPKWGGYF